MGKNLFQETGTFTPDKLIADSAIPVTAKGIRVAEGEGILKRGTLMGLASDGTYRRTATTESVQAEEEESGTAATSAIGADCILTDDVDATHSDVVTAAYVSGTFNRAAIILPEGKDIADYETELRRLGIFLRAVQEY